MTSEAASAPKTDKPSAISKRLLNLRGASTASVERLKAAIDDPPLTAEEIAERLSMFEAVGFYVPGMTAAQKAERLRLFRDVLGSTPGAIALGAFDDWFARMQRSPTPNEIAGNVSAITSRAADRLGDTSATNFDRAQAVANWIEKFDDWPTWGNDRDAAEIINRGIKTLDELDRAGWPGARRMTFLDQPKAAGD